MSTTATYSPVSRRDLGLLALLAALVFLPWLGQRDLWNPDEPRYAEVTREMLASGVYFVPHVNGHIYSEKPPLLFWTQAVAATLWGELDEVAVRLPSALSAIATVLLVYWLGCRLFNRRAAWLAALAFVSCRKILWQGQDGQIDMLLTFLVTLAVCCWLYGFQEQRSRYSYLFFLVAGLATIAKGPVGLLPPLLSIIVFLLVSGHRAEIRRLHIPTGLLVWTLPVLAWLVPATLSAGSEYLEIMLFKQNLTRYANPWHHFRPWYYYLTVIPIEFFPWSFFLPASAVLGWRHYRHKVPAGEGTTEVSSEQREPQETSSERGKRTTEREGLLFALCWVVVTLLFFSVSPAKRTVYILSMYPAMALLVGLTLDRLATAWPGSRRWFGWTVGVALVPLALITAAIPVVAARKPELSVLGEHFPAMAMVVSGLLLLATFISWILLLRGGVVPGLHVLAGGMVALQIAFQLLLVPGLETLKSARPLSKLLVEWMAPGEEYGIYPRLDAPFVFYTERFAVELTTPKELYAFCERPERVWLLIERGALRKLERPLPMVEMGGDQDLKEGYVLYRSPDRADPPASDTEQPVEP